MSDAERELLLAVADAVTRRWPETRAKMLDMVDRVKDEQRLGEMLDHRGSEEDHF